MFDLFRSRDKAVRILLGGLLGLVALSMVTYLIPNSGTQGPVNDSAAVAEIGSEKVTVQDVQAMISRLRSGGQIPADLLSIYVPQVIQQLISERAMAYEAGQMGLRVSAQDTDDAIIDTLPAQYVKDGKTVDAATLSAILQQQRQTLAQFRQTMARQLLITHLEQLVAGGVTISKQEVENEFRKRNEKVKVEYAFLTSAKYLKESEPTDAEVKAYYDAHKDSMRTPEKRSLAIVLLEQSKLAAAIQPTDAQLRAEYGSRQNEFQTPERIRARHILLKSDATNDAQIKAKAQELLKQLQGGADFAKMAKEKSEDTGSGAQGGELGWVMRNGQMVKEFEDATFALKAGQMSGLIKTSYGYHIIQAEERETAHLKPFDEVKAQLSLDLTKRLAQEQLQTAADNAASELRKDPAHPEKAAAAPGASLLRAEHLAVDEPIPGLGSAKNLWDAVSILKKGEATSGAVGLDDGKAAVAVVTDIEPAHVSSFEEAKAEARTSAQTEKSAKIVSAKASELAAKAKSMDGDLAKAAKALGIETKTSEAVDREGAIETVGSAASIPDLFTKPINSILGPVSLSSGQLVAKILEKRAADMSELQAQAQKIGTDLQDEKRKERAALFQAGLKERLTSTGKLKIHDDVVKSILQNYRQGS